jgi:phage/plasmid-like protein (TIGR03299 family)
MAHNLNYNAAEGKYSFFSVREKAWHGLGQIVQEAPTSADAIKLAGLDFEVLKKPATIDGHEIPYTFGLVHGQTGKPFAAAVGSQYTVVQNRDCFDFFDSIVGDELAIYETAGALGDGQTIFITAKLPNFIEVKGDVIEQYLFLTNSHGKGQIEAAFTPVRIVCNNTLNQALANCSHSVRLLHRRNVHDKLKQAHKVMGMVNTMKPQLIEVFNLMASKNIVEADLKEILLHSFANDSQLEILAKNEQLKGPELASITKLEGIVAGAYAYSQLSDTQQTAATRGTLFGAYNAVTGYYQNVREIKDGKAESHFNSIYGGSGYDVAQKALDLCIARL